MLGRRLKCHPDRNEIVRVTVCGLIHPCSVGQAIIAYRPLLWSGNKDYSGRQPSRIATQTFHLNTLQIPGM